MMFLNFHPFLAVMGWDDLLMAAAAAAMSAGAQRAISGGTPDTKSTGAGSIPTMENPSNPFEMFKAMMKSQGGGM